VYCSFSPIFFGSSRICLVSLRFSNFFNSNFQKTLLKWAPRRRAARRRAVPKLFLSIILKMFNKKIKIIAGEGKNSGGVEKSGTKWRIQKKKYGRLFLRHFTKELWKLSLPKKINNLLLGVGNDLLITAGMLCLSSKPSNTDLAKYSFFDKNPKLLFVFCFLCLAMKRSKCSLEREETQTACKKRVQRTRRKT